VPNTNLILNAGTTARLDLNDNQINTANVRLLAPSSLLDLNNRSAVVTDLTLVGSTVQTGGGTLTLNGSVHVNASPATAVINGILNFNNAIHNFNVADGAAADDLVVNAAIIGGGGFTSVLTKNGTGLMALTNANSYNGRTSVTNGILDVRNGQALGLYDGTINTDTTVAAGATLRLNGATNDGLILNGAAVGSGFTTADNRLVTLDVPTRAGAVNGAVTLVNAAASGGTVLVNVPGTGVTFGGAITQTQVNPVGLTFIGTGANGFTGPASNTFRGPTLIPSGALVLGKTGGAVAIRCVPSGLQAKSSPIEKVLLVGLASRSPGVRSFGSPPATGTTKRCCRLSSTYSSQWR